jgi:hypothetical protein
MQPRQKPPWRREAIAPHAGAKKPAQGRLVRERGQDYFDALTM